MTNWEKILPPKKSLLEDCAYQGADIPKNYIKEMGKYYEGYNKYHEEALLALTSKIALPFTDEELEKILPKEEQHESWCDMKENCACSCGADDYNRGRSDCKQALYSLTALTIIKA